MRHVLLALALSALIAGPIWAGETVLPAAQEIAPTVFEGRYSLSGNLGGGMGGDLSDSVVIRSTDGTWPLVISTCAGDTPRIFGRLLPGDHPSVPNALRGQIGPLPTWCAYEARDGLPVMTCATDAQGRIDLLPDAAAFGEGC